MIKYAEPGSGTTAITLITIRNRWVGTGQPEALMVLVSPIRAALIGFQKSIYVQQVSDNYEYISLKIMLRQKGNFDFIFIN